MFLYPDTAKDSSEPAFPEGVKRNSGQAVSAIVFEPYKRLFLQGD